MPFLPLIIVPDYSTIIQRFAVWLKKRLNGRKKLSGYFETLYHFNVAEGKDSFKIAETRWGHKSGDYSECVRIYEGYNLGMDFYDT